MLEVSVGRKSEKQKNIIEQGAVRKFAEALGDSAPLYCLEEAGAASCWGRNIAPPTFPVTLEAGKVPGFDLRAEGLIHGEQHYHYERPIFVGEVLYCWLEIEDYRERNGKLGKMGYITLTKHGEDERGERVFTERFVVIITEAAAKGLTG